MKLNQPKIIPMSKAEAMKIGWNEIDVLLITGDAFVDHPSFGSAIIARELIENGYRVGVIAQPDWHDKNVLNIFGRPKLACAVSSGNLDSMLNIYTAARRKRKNDSYSPGGKTELRPPLAVNVYSNMAKAAFPGLPIIIGGLEASMRRIAHYDYWKDQIQPSILQTSKADVLVYGMGETTIVKILERIKSNESYNEISGTAVFLKGKESEEFVAKTENYLELPSLEEVKSTKGSLLKSHIESEQEMNPYSGRILIQWHNKRLIVVNRPALPLGSDRLDAIYSLPYSRMPHPKYKEKIPAFEMIKDSITSIRGCPGGCSFCGLGLHQGRFLQSRSQSSIISEIKKLTEKNYFRGTVSDVGGPTANAYKNTSKNTEICKKCKRASCLFPKICSNYKITENELITLLNEILKLDKVKHVFINSGLRLDLATRQNRLLKAIIKNHVSGHLKVAPEHLDEGVLKLMRKNPACDFYNFIDFFDAESKKLNKKQYLVPYFISNFPGADKHSIEAIDSFLGKTKWSLQQVQDFIPLPMTIASAMYYEGLDTNFNKIKVNRGLKERRPQAKKLKRKK